MSNLASSFVRHRRSFAKVQPIIDMPNLIEIQKRSFAEFLQGVTASDARDETGLQGVFKSIFPVRDFDGTASVEFVSYALEEPKYSVEECRSKGLGYAVPVKVLVRLVIFDVDRETNTKSIRGFKEQEVYFGEIPLMTENGTFIVNGTERVVVSQLHRSPGVFFDHDKGKNHASGKFLYNARIIPYRGSWLDFEFDAKDIMYCRIDRRRKMPATILLKALGLTTEELLEHFYDREEIIVEKEQFFRKINLELLRGQRASADIKDPRSDKILVKRNRKIGLLHIKQLQAAGVEKLSMTREEVVGKIIGRDVVDEDTGEVLFPINQEISEPLLESILKRSIKKVEVLFIDDVNVDSAFRDTLISDKTASTEDALMEIYRRMRPGDPPTPENASQLFENLFFVKERYDLSRVGRMKLNEKLGLTIDSEHRTLTRDDILGTVKMLLDVRSGKVKVDDIDHLGNRRVRAVGELLENQYRIGLTRIERAIKERLQLQELDSLMPHDLVNAKPVAAVVKEFFGSSQLSQFMEQANPLAEVYHKRRLSALGPGGLSRERAGFEVRDVHPTHYGRICPIETPEGPNIGLIVSLASYARVNQYGFIETPYRKVIDRKPTSDVKYYTSSDEWKEDFVVAQATAAVGGEIAAEDLIPARQLGDPNMVSPEDITYMDVATCQSVSAAAALIPFIQNDDPHRALMGANMQRQALPLLRTSAPLVGTGMERKLAMDSGVTLVAKRAGTVIRVDAERVVIRGDDAGNTSDQTEVASEVDIYNLVKFTRSNVDTCINQKPIVRIGEHVSAGDIIADGFSTETGELALGQNVVVAFLPWAGYNFEDAIVVSERVVREDMFTSIHIQEFECISRDTKLGKEEITSDIPNVGEESLKNLDDAGIVCIGAEVKPGDILVGKLTPKAETQLTPEEKLLRAIFGEKAADVRETSLRVPPGVSGTVIGAKVFSRESADQDSRMVQIQEQEISKLKKDEQDRIEIIRTSALEKLSGITVGETAAVTIESKHFGVVRRIKAGEQITAEIFQGMSLDQVRGFEIVSPAKGNLVAKLKKSMDEKIALVRAMTEEQISRIKRGDELPPGVIKMVKVYVAIKRRLQVGDKLAGRHGNKGVISKIAPIEDMPHLENGEPVDIVLSPLGVPSRMNIGQVLETHFGWAARGIGRKINEMLEKSCPRKELEEFLMRVWDDPSVHSFVKSCSNDELRAFIRKYKQGVTIANPVFDGASEAEICSYLELADLPQNGQMTLYDGRTGRQFERPVTVGVMYILKLHHLVDEKIHARSIGPYSLVTQQPLGGKAQFGGQRLGEMEVWAMEAYGAAYSLQEFLTVKSDDIIGRTKMYEAIVKGENMMIPGLPESFNVLVKEMQSLALDVNLIREGEEVTLEDLQREASDSQ